MFCTQAELSKKIADHEKWWKSGGEFGERLVLENVSLSGAKMPGADLRGATLYHVDFSGANLHRANFTGLELKGCQFSNARMDSTSWRGSSLRGCRMGYADVVYADFTGAIMDRCTLDHSVFREATFQRTKLVLVSSIGGYFGGARFLDTEFDEVSFTSTSFRGALFSGANLRTTNLVSADFSECTGLNWAQVSFAAHGQCGRMLTAVDTPEGAYYWCGCFRGTEEELREYIETDDSTLVKSRTLALDTVIEFLNMERELLDWDKRRRG